jgi:5-methylcytosine-specific restriction endonuclease McrA
LNVSAGTDGCPVLKGDPKNALNANQEHGMTKMANRIYDYDKPIESGNSYKKSVYASTLYYDCSNPFCKDGLDPEVHHIIPLSRGGMDRYYNYVVLCRHCHRSSGVHSHWEFMLPILNSWKTNQELKVLGFVLEEGSAKYHKNVLRLISTEPYEIKKEIIIHRSKRETFHDKKKRLQSASDYKSKTKAPISKLDRMVFGE